MNLKPVNLSDFRRRQAQAQGKPAPKRAPFERHSPITVPFRVGSPQRCDVIVLISGEGHALDSRQALELARALMGAAAECPDIEGA